MSDGYRRRTGNVTPSPAIRGTRDPLASRFTGNPVCVCSPYRSRAGTRTPTFHRTDSDRAGFHQKPGVRPTSRSSSSSRDARQSAFTGNPVSARRISVESVAAVPLSFPETRSPPAPTLGRAPFTTRPGTGNNRRRWVPVGGERPTRKRENSLTEKREQPSQ